MFYSGMKTIVITDVRKKKTWKHLSGCLFVARNASKLGGRTRGEHRNFPLGRDGHPQLTFLLLHQSGELS